MKIHFLAKMSGKTLESVEYGVTIGPISPNKESKIISKEDTGDGGPFLLTEMGIQSGCLPHN